MSMPSVVERLRNLTPDVPSLILNQASTDVEKHLLNQGSLLDQQNVIIGETLDKVLTQTTATNGRVTEQEKAAKMVRNELDEHNKFIAKADENTKRWRRWQALGFPVGTAILIFILELLSKHFHWT